MAHEYDLIIKALAERYPDHIVELVRGIPAENVRRVEKEAVAVKRDTDVLFEVTEDGYEYLMLVEMQTRPDRQMPKRLLEYTSMQHREHKKPVYPVVINFTGRPQPESYSFECLDLTVVAFNYRQINLADLPGRELLRRGPLGIIPLVPLMRHDDPPEKVLAGCAGRIEEAPPELQPDLYFGLAVFSSIRFSKELISKYIEVSKMENSPLFDGIREKWIDLGEQKGIQAGIQKGARTERIEAILETLEVKTGRRPNELAIKLNKIKDMEVLRMFHRQAVKAKSLEEFTTAVDEALKE